METPIPTPDPLAPEEVTPEGYELAGRTSSLPASRGRVTYAAKVAAALVAAGWYRLAHAGPRVKLAAVVGLLLLVGLIVGVAAAAPSTPAPTPVPVVTATPSPTATPSTTTKPDTYVENAPWYVAKDGTGRACAYVDQTLVCTGYDGFESTPRCIPTDNGGVACKTSAKSESSDRSGKCPSGTAGGSYGTCYVCPPGSTLTGSDCRFDGKPDGTVRTVTARRNSGMPTLLLSSPGSPAGPSSTQSTPGTPTPGASSAPGPGGKPEPAQDGPVGDKPTYEQMATSLITAWLASDGMSVAERRDALAPYAADPLLSSAAGKGPGTGEYKGQSVVSAATAGVSQGAVRVVVTLLYGAKVTLTTGPDGERFVSMT